MEEKEEKAVLAIDPGTANCAMVYVKATRNGDIKVFKITKTYSRPLFVSKATATDNYYYRINIADIPSYIELKEIVHLVIPDDKTYITIALGV